MRRAFIAFLSILLLWGLNACQPKSALEPIVSITALDKPYGILDLDALAESKSRIIKADPLFLGAFEHLKDEAQAALTLTPPSVMDKSFIPPSGDKHDYMSMSPYWWPDPSKPDGLPYIRKDGLVNPERNAYDKIPGATMAEAVKVLSLMYHFTEDEIYASKAAELLKVWFIQAETRMHPHLDYGQFVPGKSIGRSVGIIESRQFVMITDYERFLLASPSWTSADHQLLVDWMSQFLDWLLTSKLGKKEGAARNNHGSWYDYQVLALSQYCDRPEAGRQVMATFTKNRLEEQIAADGSQPEELVRTKSFNYSVFNLDALTNLVRLSHNVTHSPDEHAKRIAILGRGLSFLIPVIEDTLQWRYEQISPFRGALERMISPMTYVLSYEPDSDFRSELAPLLSRYPDSRHILMTPIVQMSQMTSLSVD